MTVLKVLQQCADIICRDAALESLDAVDGNHRNAVAIALEDRRVAPDINLIEGEVVIGGEVFQMRPRVIAQVTASFHIEQNDGSHVRFLQAAYRSDSGMARTRG